MNYYNKTSAESSMMDKPLILFDMDGTLILTKEKFVHSAAVFQEEMKKIVLSYGIPRNEVAGLNRMTHILNKARKYAETHRFDQTTIDDMVKEMIKPFKKQEILEHANSILLPDTIHGLEALKSGGYEIGLVTSASRAGYESISNSTKFGCFGKYFQTSITRDDCIYIKPDPEPILKALQLFKKTKFVYIGDSDYDAEATATANGVFILINTKKYENDILKLLNPYAIIEKISDLPPILKQL
jgi:HAD superfamily hydrolase (TIGR01549 family)